MTCDSIRGLEHGVVAVALHDGGERCAYLRRRRSVIAAQTKAPAPMTVTTRATVPSAYRKISMGSGTFD
jgi:hypothetical protein